MAKVMFGETPFLAQGEKRSAKPKPKPKPKPKRPDRETTTTTTNPVNGMTSQQEQEMKSLEGTAL